MTMHMVVRGYRREALGARHPAEASMKLRHRASVNPNIPASVNLFSDEFRWASDEAADLLEFLFFFRAESMVVFVFSIELRMRIAKLVICLD